MPQTVTVFLDKVEKVDLDKVRIEAPVFEEPAAPPDTGLLPPPAANDPAAPDDPMEAVRRANDAAAGAGQRK